MYSSKNWPRIHQLPISRAYNIILIQDLEVLQLPVTLTWTWLLNAKKNCHKRWKKTTFSQIEWCSPVTSQYGFIQHCLPSNKPPQNTCSDWCLVETYCSVPTLDNLPIIPGNTVFPFQREWLSYVHSVNPLQWLTGIIAETFIQVQSSYAGHKKWYLAHMFVCLEFQAWATAADKPPTLKYPNQGQDSFTAT